MSFGDALRARTALVNDLKQIGNQFSFLPASLEDAANQGRKSYPVWFMTGDQGPRIRALLEQHGLTLSLEEFTDDDPDFNQPTQSGWVTW